VREFLKEMSELFEIVIFTASHGCYANVVLDHLDPKREWVSHRLFREKCIQTESGGVYIKDLRVIDRVMSEMVLVDNASYSFGFQIDSGIPIIPFYDSKEDSELKS
jgi:CTD small phosphatase-like protein 2